MNSPIKKRERIQCASGLLLLSVSACGVEPVQPSKGVSVPEGLCGHALVVLTSDYQASSAGVLGFDGKVLDKSILSSASATTGLSAPLSGDVVLPTTRTPNGIVLIDRTGPGVITWLDPPTGKVTHQVPVGAQTNPHDYLELSPQKAYVSRFEINPNAGAQPFDRGGDVAVIDPTKPAKLAIVSSIHVAEHLLGLPPDEIAHPDRMVRAGAEIVVLVQVYTRDFKASGDSSLVRIDPDSDAVKGTVALSGLRGCAALAVSPSSKAIAVGCSGVFGGTSKPELTNAGVVVLDATSYQPMHAWTATDLMGAPPAFSISFASEDAIFIPTFGAADTGTPDRLLRAEIASGAVTLLSSSHAAFDFGEVRCAPQCGACFMTDAGSPRVMRFPVDQHGVATGATDIPFGDAHQPPRYLGVY